MALSPTTGGQRSMKMLLGLADMNDNGETLGILSCCGETVHPVYEGDGEQCNKCYFCSICVEFYDTSKTIHNCNLDEQENEDLIDGKLFNLRVCKNIDACLVCGQPTVILMTKEQFEQYEDWKRSGFVAPIQNALTTFSKGERERIISGTHDECWAKI